MDYVNGPGRNHLFVPGPVNIPEQVLRAMNRNNEDYRSPAVPALTKVLLEDVKKIFKTTSGTPFLIPTTGIVIRLVSYSLSPLYLHRDEFGLMIYWFLKIQIS